MKFENYQNLEGGKVDVSAKMVTKECRTFRWNSADKNRIAQPNLAKQKHCLFFAIAKIMSLKELIAKTKRSLHSHSLRKMDRVETQDGMKPMKVELDLHWLGERTGYWGRGPRATSCRGLIRDREAEIDTHSICGTYRAELYLRLNYQVDHDGASVRLYYVRIGPGHLLRGSSLMDTHATPSIGCNPVELRAVSGSDSPELAALALSAEAKLVTAPPVHLRYDLGGWRSTTQH